MKISLFMMFVCACQLFAIEADAQSAVIELKTNKLSIEELFKEIEKQTDYLVIYSTSGIRSDFELLLTKKRARVSEYLEEALKGRGLKYEFSSNYIIVSGAKEDVLQQEKKRLTGIVYDSNGEAVIGANVIEKGVASNGTITDMEGRFSLNVASDATLLISYIGFNTAEVSVKGKSALKIVLQDDSELLDEVVVIGYTSQKKGLLTGAVATMKVNENMKTIPTTSAGNMLVGKLAGVNVSTSDAIPGSNPSLSIRTSSSWYRESNKNPQPVTYVIDGIIRESSDFNNLSPNEIEDITVLKDAASAAIYGSRSAGGVVIVTTKKGNKGKPTFNYSYGYSVDTRTKNVDLTDGVQTAELYTRINGSADPAGWAWSQDELDYIKTINNGWGYDRLEAVWQNPSTQTHNLSVNGGNDKVRYFGAASYAKQEGFLIPLNYDKYNIRMNVTADITKDFEVFTSFALNNNFKGNAVFEDAGANYSKLRTGQPEEPIFTNGGRYIDTGWIANLGASVDGSAGYNKEQYLKPQVVISGTYKAPFLKGLSAKVTYSKSWTNNIQKKFYTNYDFVTTKKSGTNGRIISVDDNDIIRTRKSTWVGKNYIERKSTWGGDKQFNVQLNYENVFKNIHRVSAALVTEWYEDSGAGVTGGRETFPVYLTDQFWAASSARADTWSDGDTDRISGRMSYIGQFSYSYADKYLLNFSFREDGSMKFASDQRWGFFPAGSLGWVISEENFFNKSAVQFLKLRGSVGLTGDDSVGGWQWQESYKTDKKDAYFGETPSKSVGITYGSVVNPNLTWEKSLSYNIGADVNFFNHWSMSADYWYRNTYDILDNRISSLPSTFSLSMPAENYGEMHAQGFDLQLGYRGQSNKFSYFVNLTLSYGWNKIITKDFAENAQWIDISQGKSSNYIKGWAFDRIIRTQADLDAFNAANPNYRHNGMSPELGMLVFKDLNGPNGKPDGVIDDWDRVMLRAKNFPVVYGLNLGGSWKGLSVDMMFSGKLGEKKSIKNLAEGVEWNRMWTGWYDDAWTPETPDATLPKRFSNSSPGKKSHQTDCEFWLKDASFMRLKYLTVSYDLPKNQFYNKIFDNVRLFATGTNLFVLSSFNKKYYDPEIGGGNSFPVLRSFNFGVDVKF